MGKLSELFKGDELSELADVALEMRAACTISTRRCAAPRPSRRRADMLFVHTRDAEEIRTASSGSAFAAMVKAARQSYESLAQDKMDPFLGPLADYRYFFVHRINRPVTER